MKTFAKISMGCAIFVVALIVAGFLLFKGVAKFFSGMNFTTGPAQGAQSTPDGYAVEGDTVYWTQNSNFFGNWVAGRKVVEGADAKTFTKIEADKEKFPDASNTSYGKDAKQVFYDGKVITGADPVTFKDLGWPLAADATHMFYNGQIIEKADPGSFTILDREFSRYRDKNHVYAREKIIEGADPATYELVGDRRLGRDKKDYYLRNNDDYDNGEFALHVRDMGSFKLLIPAEPAQRYNPWENLWKLIWARDNQCFYVGDKAITIADPATFQSFGQGYAKDAKQVYYLNAILADADPQTFQIVSPDHPEGWLQFAGYGKDAKQVYYKGKVLNDADAATFVMLNEREFKDKNHRYNQGGRLGPNE